MPTAALIMVIECEGEGVRQQHREGGDGEDVREGDGEGVREGDGEGVREQHGGSMMVRV